MKDSIKREQSQMSLNSAERENSRTKCKVKIQTMLGDIVVRLYDETPIHRANFLKLAKEGYYDGTLFHRVIKDFMIQGGDPDSKGAPAGKILGVGDPGYTLEAEIKDGLFHKRGALAAARQGDEVNPDRRSSGSQFYIVWGIMQMRRDRNRAGLQELQDKLAAEAESKVGKTGLTDDQLKIYSTIGGTPHLDGQYTIFGEVEEGLDVVEMIQGTATGRADRPVDDIEMRMIVIE